MKTKLIFIRHGESEKNIIDISGGKGKPLTIKGVNQANKLAENLSNKYSALTSNISIISAPAIQAQETAKIVAKFFDLDFVVNDSLKPASLGIVDGLTRDYVDNQYPSISNKLKLWRDGKLEAIQLDIEGMESPLKFWNRMIKYMDNCRNGCVNMIFCTRSIMVFALNFVNENLPTPGGGYKHFKIDNCDIVEVTIDDEITKNIL